MNFKEAFFILQHGSSEVEHKYLESVQVVREYVKCLEDKNRELKRLLKLAIEDFDTLFEETPECSFNLDCKYCPFGEIDTDGIPNCNEWRYKEEAEKLLEGDNK